MYSSSDGEKQFIVGVVSQGIKANKQAHPCDPGTIIAYPPIYPHLDWIRALMGDERCITNTFRIEPSGLWAHLLAIAMSILCIALTAYLILTERIKNSNDLNDSPSK